MANVSSPIRHPSIDVALEQLRAGVSALPLDERERALREGTERLMALDLREGLGEAAIRRMASRVVASVVHSGCDMVDGLRPAHSRHSLFKRSAHGGASRAEAWALLAPGRQAPADWSSCAQTLFEGAAKIGRCAYGSGPDYLGADHGRALLTLLEAVVAAAPSREASRRASMRTPPHSCVPRRQPSCSSSSQSSPVTGRAPARSCSPKRCGWRNARRRPKPILDCANRWSSASTGCSRSCRSRCVK